MFAEETEIGFVGGAPAEEEKLVFGDGCFAHLVGMFALKLIAGGESETESFHKFWSGGLVAFIGEVEAIVGEALAVSKSGEEVCELELVFFCKLSESLRIKCESLVVLCHVR